MEYFCAIVLIVLSIVLRPDSKSHSLNVPAAGDETYEESGSIVLGLDFIRIKYS